MKFLKKNYLVIVLFLICSFLVFKSNYEINQMNKQFEYKFQERLNYCKKNINSLEGDYKKSCENIIATKTLDTRKEFYEKFDYILGFGVGYFNVLASLVLFIISLKEVTKIFQNRIALLMLKRENYFKFLKKIFFHTYKYIWFWPAVIIVVILVSLEHTYYNPSVSYQTAIWGIELMNNPIMFFTLYILNLLFISGLYINIGLIVVRYKHNYPIAVILSFLTVIAIELFFEIGINGIVLPKVFNNYDKGLIFNIINAFTFNVAEAKGVLNLLLFSGLCFFISFIILILCYKNKEKLIIDCEKNN